MFRGILSKRMRLTDICRWIARTAFSLDPFLRRTIRSADICVAATDQTLKRMKRLKPREVLVMPLSATTGNGIMAEAMTIRSARKPSPRFRLVSIGGLNSWRGIDLTIRALAKCRVDDVEYHHYCDGTARTRCERLARELGVSDRVFFHGDQPHADNLRALALADVLIHMVLRDSQGVLCEAMALGIPIITINHLTPATLVSESCAHLCSMTAETTPESLVDELADVIRRFRENPDLLQRLGHAGTLRARQFTPERRGEEIRRLHERVLAAPANLGTRVHGMTPQRA